MPSVTLRQLAQESKIPNERLAQLIRQLLVEQSEEWNLTLFTNDKYKGRTEAGAELEMAYHQGRAHAICEILGDQTDLQWFIDRLEGEPEKTRWMHSCPSCGRVWEDEDQHYKTCPSCGKAYDYFPSVTGRSTHPDVYVGKDKGLRAVLDEPAPPPKTSAEYVEEILARSPGRRAKSVVHPTNPNCDSWE